MDTIQLHQHDQGFEYLKELYKDVNYEYLYEKGYRKLWPYTQKWSVDHGIWRRIEIHEMDGLEIYVDGQLIYKDGSVFNA